MSTYEKLEEVKSTVATFISKTGPMRSVTVQRNLVDGEPTGYLALSVRYGAMSESMRLMPSQIDDVIDALLEHKSVMDGGYVVDDKIGTYGEADEKRRRLRVEHLARREHETNEVSDDE